MAAWTPVGMAIVTNLGHGIRALLSQPPPAKRAAPGPFARAPRLDGSRLTDRYLLQQIANLQPPGSVIVEEAPSSRGPMHDYLPIVEPDGFYTCSSGGLGHSLPAAVGVALARPDRKVIAILGDGSSMYSIQGLWSAAQLGLSIAFIIIRNGRYEALHEFGQHFRLDQLPGTELPQIDFCGLARAQGVSASQVASAGELDAALSQAFRSSEPVLVEVVTQKADTSNSGESTCGPQS